MRTMVIVLAILLMAAPAQADGLGVTRQAVNKALAQVRMELVEGRPENGEERWITLGDFVIEVRGPANNVRSIRMTGGDASSAVKQVKAMYALLDVAFRDWTWRKDWLDHAIKGLPKPQRTTWNGTPVVLLKAGYTLVFGINTD